MLRARCGVGSKNNFKLATSLDGSSRDGIIQYMAVPVFSIIIAGIASALVGFLWYHPRVFGAAWMRMSNVTPEMANASRRGMLVRALVALVAATIAAFVMSFFMLAWGISDWIGCVVLAFWCWLGFVAPAMLGQVLWERKPFALYLINSLYWLVSFVIIALILQYI